MQYRIGDRDPVTGLYNVIWPDGSSTLNGVKIFNAAHAVGDVVLATQRSDGMMILDRVKAYDSITTSQTSEFGLQKFGEKPSGYLAGQVFNNEDEPILPIVSIEFAPGSPTELAPNAGNFVVRIKIDRPQRRDLRVRIELTGTAPSGDYSYVGLDDDSIDLSSRFAFAVIPAGDLFFDVVITPTQNQLRVGETIVIRAIKSRDYRIDLDLDRIVATIIPVLKIVSLSITSPTNSLYISDNSYFVVRISLLEVSTTDTIVDFDITGLDINNNEYFTNLLNEETLITIPAGQLFFDFEVYTTYVPGTLNISLIALPDYVLGTASSVTLNILAYIASIAFAPTNPTVVPIGTGSSFSVRFSLDLASGTPVDIYYQQIATDQANAQTIIEDTFVTVPANQTYFDLIVTPLTQPYQRKTLGFYIQPNNNYILAATTEVITEFLTPVISLRSSRAWALPGNVVNWVIRRRYLISQRDSIIAAGRLPVINADNTEVNCLYGSQLNPSAVQAFNLNFEVPLSGELGLSVTIGTPATTSSLTTPATPQQIGYLLLNITASTNTIYTIEGNGAGDSYVPIYRSPYNVTAYRHTRFVSAQIFRVLYYQNVSTLPNHFFSYEQATINGGNSSTVTNFISPTTGLVYASLRRVGQSRDWKEFVEEIVTPIYTRLTTTTAVPAWVAADQSPSIDKAIYRALTGLLTTPNGTSCPTIFAPAIALLPISFLNDTTQSTPDYIVPSTVGSTGSPYPTFSVSPLMPGVSANQRWGYGFRDRRANLSGTPIFTGTLNNIQTNHVSSLGNQTVTPLTPTTPSLYGTWVENPVNFDQVP